MGQRLQYGRLRARRPRPSRLPLLAVLMTAFGLVFSGAATANDVALADYAETVQRLNLQDEVEILPEDADWRGLLDVEETPETQEGGFRPDIDVIRFMIWLMAALVVIFIVFLIIRYGAAIQVGIRADAGRDGIGNDSPQESLSAVVGEKVSSLDDVLAMEDEARALGALLRLVLESALGRMEMSLKRSETARAVLRRLPRDWEHFIPVARLVGLAERVRYAGDPIDREGLITAVEDVRTVLQAGPIR